MQSNTNKSKYEIQEDGTVNFTETSVREHLTMQDVFAMRTNAETEKIKKSNYIKQQEILIAKDEAMIALYDEIIAEMTGVE